MARPDSTLTSYVAELPSLVSSTSFFFGNSAEESGMTHLIRLFVVLAVIVVIFTVLLPGYSSTEVQG